MISYADSRRTLQHGQNSSMADGDKSWKSTLQKRNSPRTNSLPERCTQTARPFLKQPYRMGGYISRLCSCPENEEWTSTNSSGDSILNLACGSSNLMRMMPSYQHSDLHGAKNRSTCINMTTNLESPDKEDFTSITLCNCASILLLSVFRKRICLDCVD